MLLALDTPSVVAAIAAELALRSPEGSGVTGAVVKAVVVAKGDMLLVLVVTVVVA